MDSIGFHPTNGYRWSPSDNISALPNIYLTSGTLSRRDFRLSYFRRKVSPIEFCLFHRITTFSIGIHWCVLDMHGGRNKGKFDNHLICFNLYSEDSYTKLRNLKHSISRRGSDFGTSYKLFKGFLPYTLGTIKYQSLKKIWIFKSNNWNTQPHEQTSLTMKHNQKLGCSFSEIISSGKLQRTQMESSVWNSNNFL